MPWARAASSRHSRISPPDAVPSPLPVHRHPAHSARPRWVTFHQQHSSGTDYPTFYICDDVGCSGVGFVQLLFRWNLLLHHEYPHANVDGSFQFFLGFHQFDGNVNH